MVEHSFKMCDAPVFLEFLTKLFEKLSDVDSDFKNISFDLEKDFLINGYCKCKQKECATVYMQYLKKFDKEILGSHVFDSNKGCFIIHFEEDGYVEFEALGYNFFPYKTEIYNLFNTTKRRLNRKKFKSVESYFHNFKFKNINIVDIGYIDEE